MRASASMSAALFDQAEAVAQPLHQRAGDERAALQRVRVGARSLVSSVQATVVSRPRVESFGSAPTFISRKAPVP